jgi:F-type H+-transporting ATPase subunit b
MDIQLPQLLFQIVNFSVVFGALVYLLYKPLMKILDERAERVSQSLKEVELATQEKEKLQALKIKTKREAEKAAAEILEEAKKIASKRKQELTAETKETLAKEMQKAQSRWQAEKKQMTATMKKQLIESVIQVSGLVIGKKLDKKTNEKLIAQGLEEVLQSL